MQGSAVKPPPRVVPVANATRCCNGPDARSHPARGVAPWGFPPSALQLTALSPPERTARFDVRWGLWMGVQRQMGAPRGGQLLRGTSPDVLCRPSLPWNSRTPHAFSEWRYDARTTGGLAAADGGRLELTGGAGVLGAAQNAREAQRRVDEYKRDELVKCVPTLPPFALVLNQSRGAWSQLRKP